LTDYTQVIQNFRLAALEKMQDSEFMKEISDERKTELFDLDDFFWIKDKISNLAEKNGLSFLEQAILIKDNENDYPEFTIDDRRQIRKNLKEKPGVDKRHFLGKCQKRKIPFVDEHYRQWQKLRLLNFGKQERHPFRSWDQFCRLCVAEYDRFQFMSNRIWKLYGLHLKHHKNAYFDFKEQQLGEPTYHNEFPKNFPRIELLDTQSRKFFFIYKMLLNNVSFNPEKKGTTNAKPKGRINWIKTIQKQSRGETLSFVTHQNAKDFVTSENQLVILAAHLLFIKASELLKTATSASVSEKILLTQIKMTTHKIIDTFPFPQVQLSIKKHKYLDNFEKTIPELLRDANKRITTGKIQNPSYKKLLKWINDFLNDKGMHTLMGREQTDSLVFLSLRNIDTMYEIWIFFELIHHIVSESTPQFHRIPKYNEKGKVNEREGLIDKISVDWKGKKLEIFYEKQMFLRDSNKVFPKCLKCNPHKRFLSISNNKETSLYEPDLVDQFSDHEPDFLFRLGEKNIAVFDAKNYVASELYDSKGGEARGKNKVMSYMKNLQCNLGIVVWPTENYSHRLKKIKNSNDYFLSLHFEPSFEQEKEHAGKIKEIMNAVARVTA